MKRVVKYTILFITILAVIYCFCLFILPRIFNSKIMVRNYEQFLSSKLNSEVVIEKFSFSLTPALSSNISVKNIIAANNKERIIDIKELRITSKKFSVFPATLDAENIYVDITSLTNLKRDSKSSKFNLSYNILPIINIDKFFIKLDKNGSFIDINNIISKSDSNSVICKFTAIVHTHYLTAPLVLGKNGYLYWDKNLGFENFLVSMGKSDLYISGRLGNLYINGANLPVKELEEAFLYFYKKKHPNKKNFIENFQKFSGTMDVNLTLSDSGFHGTCKTKNLSALFSKFKILVELPETVFYFKEREIKAKTTGYFGSEPVYTDFHLTGLASKQLKVVGNVESWLTNKFSSKYFKPIQIAGKAKAKVKYKVENSIVDIDYSLMIPKGSNVLSSYGSIDNTDVNRLISAHTIKQGDNIRMSEYKYEFITPASRLVLLEGDGLFSKMKGSYRPVQMTVKTRDKVKLRVIKSFIRGYLKGGYFTADLKYDFIRNKLGGYLNLYETSHKDFLYLKDVQLKVSDKFVDIRSCGSFYGSPVKFKFSADNDIKNVVIHKIEIVLDKFYIRKGKIATTKPKIKSNKSNYVQSVTVKNGRILVKEINHSKFNLYNVEMFAKMNNNIVEFIVPQTSYAKGILSASGIYNLSNHSSDIKILAFEIDSNEAASKLFNLYNQIEGSAYAYLHLITRNKLNDIKAHATFAVSDGYLPMLGSREFIVSGSKTHKLLFFMKKPLKFTLSKISNIDFSNQDVLSSDLNGSFMLDNYEIKNAKIFSKSEYISLFIEGNYNIQDEYGRLCIWGRHNKLEEKKIRIFKIPLSILYKILFKKERSRHVYVDKIRSIPPINAKPEEEGLFRVLVNGNINNKKDLKVILKDIK